MPRKPLIRSDFHPYQVVNRTLDRKFYEIDRDLLWETYTDCLLVLSVAYGFRIHAFVLMSNHYHLLVSTPDENLDEGIRYLQTEVSKRVAEHSGSSGFRFETRYKWTIIYEVEHYIATLCYVYQNPIRAGICNSVSEFPYSTLHGMLGYSRLPIPLYIHDLQADHFLEPDMQFELEKWVDNPMPEHKVKQVRTALRRFEFKYAKNQSNACKKVAGTSKKVAGTVQK